jgi:hypothetical protein
VLHRWNPLESTQKGHLLCIAALGKVKTKTVLTGDLSMSCKDERLEPKSMSTGHGKKCNYEHVNSSCMGIQRLGLALSMGHTRVGVSFPSPEEGNRSKLPKRCVF